MLSSEAKVGLITLAFGGLSFLATTNLTDLGHPKSKSFHVIFDSVAGLNIKSSVYLAGVAIGTVEEIELLTDRNNKVRVTVSTFNPDVTLYPPIDSDQDIGYIYKVTGNLMGEKWVEIVPREVPDNTSPLADNQEILGATPISMDTVATEGMAIVQELGTTAKLVNNVIGDEQMVDDLKVSVHNLKYISDNLGEASNSAKHLMSNVESSVSRLEGQVESTLASVNSTATRISKGSEEITQDIKKLSGTAKRLLVANEDNLNAVVSNLKDSSNSLKVTMHAVEDIAQNEGLRSDILATADHIEKATSEISGIASDIRSITNDDQVQSDLKETINNVKEVSASSKRLSGQFADGKTQWVGIDLWQEWNTDNGNTHSNANLWIMPNGNYGFKLGLESLGNDDLINAQLARHFGSVRVRGGVIRSEFGLGADAWLFNRNFEVQLDAYDPDNIQVDLFGRYYIGDNFFVTGGYRNLFDNDEHDPGHPSIGAGLKF